MPNCFNQPLFKFCVLFYGFSVLLEGLIKPLFSYFTPIFLTSISYIFELKIYILHQSALGSLNSGLRDFEIKVLRYIPKSQTVPADNFLIQTQGQWEVKRPALLAGCGEVNGKFHGFHVNFGPKQFRSGTPRPRRCGPFSMF